MKFVIPNNPNELSNRERITIKTFAPNIAKGSLLRIFAPKPEDAYKVNQPLSDNPPPVIYGVRDNNRNLGKSYLGSVVLSDLRLQDKVTKAEIVVETALFNVTQAKVIIKTDIQGRDGTVKEYISLGDYKISIKGVILGNHGVYPDDTKTINKTTVSELINMCLINKSLTVNSWYLRQFNIFDIVIESFTLGQLEGEYSSQTFEIEALSDTPFELIINK